MEFALFGCFVFAVGLLIVGFSGGKREPQPAPAPAPLNMTFIFMMVIALVALLIATGSGYVWIIEL